MRRSARDLLLADESASAALREWQRVYEGLSEEEIAAVEEVALDRSISGAKSADDILPLASRLPPKAAIRFTTPFRCDEEPLCPRTACAT